MHSNPSNEFATTSGRGTQPKLGSLAKSVCIHNVIGRKTSTTASFEGIEDFDTDVEAAHPILSECRVFKTPKEIEYIRMAMLVSSQVGGVFIYLVSFTSLVDKYLYSLLLLSQHACPHKLLFRLLHGRKVHFIGFPTVRGGFFFFVSRRIASRIHEISDLKISSRVQS